jgi:hypothetical protein
MLSGTVEDPLSWNRYAYARNNPLTYVDPDGKAPRFAAFAFSAAHGDGYASRAVASFVNTASALGTAAVAWAGGMAAAGQMGGFGLASFEGWTSATAKAAGETVVLGETMRRVEPVAERMGAATFNPAWTSFRDVMVKNIKWLQSQISRGAQIFDIGTDPTRPSRSVFFRAETKLLEKSGYVREYAGEIIVKGEKVKLYRWVPGTEKAAAK